MQRVQLIQPTEAQGRAKELLAEVMTIDNPQVIRSTVQLALKNMGLTRMMNPAAIKPY